MERRASRYSSRMSLLVFTYARKSQTRTYRYLPSLCDFNVPRETSYTQTYTQVAYIKQGIVYNSVDN